MVCYDVGKQKTAEYASLSFTIFSHVARVGVGLSARPCFTVKPRQQEPEFPAAGAAAEELIRQLFLEISVHFGAFRHDDESVGVDAAHQAQ